MGSPGKRQSIVGKTSQVNALLTHNTRAFSLVEVVLALGICSFALLAILGLFMSGIQTSRESEDEIQAANMASLIISKRAAASTNDIANFAIPTRALTNAFNNAYNNGETLTNYIDFDGQITTLTKAAYLINCRAGTNILTGPNTAQVYLMLSWPARSNPTNNSVGRYEIVTQIPLR